MARLQKILSGHMPAVLAVVVAMLALGVKLGGRPNAAPTAAAAQSIPSVKITPTGGLLKPSTTFNVQFPAPMVDSDYVGLPATTAPVVFNPPLKGKFIWLSQSSGVFTPEEAFPLGAKYTVSLRVGLLNRDGVLLPAGVLATYAAPVFQATLTGETAGALERNLQPNLTLRFTAPVDANTTAQHLTFRSDKGLRIPAEVQSAHHHHMNRDEDNEDGEAPAPAHVILVRPQQPLTPGKWSLLVAKGLPAVGGAFQTQSESALELGVVEPLAVTSIIAQNYLHVGRSIEIHLSRPLPQSANATALRRFIVLKSQQADVAIPEWELTADGRALRLHGKLPLGQYTVTVRAGLPLVAGFTLGKTRSEIVQIDALESRTFLEAHSDSQSSGGRRTLRLLSLNNRELRVRVKQIDPTYLASLREGYADGYFTKQNWQNDVMLVRPGQALAYDVVPGKTVYEWRTAFADGDGLPLKTRGAVDVPADVELNWDTVLNRRAHGLLFVEVAGIGRVRGAQSVNQAIVQLTDIGVVWKRTADDMTAHVFSLRTGKPLSNAALRLVGKENSVLAQAETDATGIAQIALREDARWLRVDHGGDVHLLPAQDWVGEVPMWRFRIHHGTEPAEGGRLFAFTDRPVYRPGETLHLKGIFRQFSSAAMHLPVGMEARVICFDARGHEFRRQTLPMSALGSVDADLLIPEGALGGWRASLGIHHKGDKPEAEPIAERTLNFQVQEYQPSTYKITMPDRVELRAGQSLELPLAVQYYFGKPLQRAPVKWMIEGAATGFAPADYEAFQFLDFTGRDNEDADSPGEYQLQGNAKLDETGRLLIAPQLPANRDWPKPVEGRLTARVTDINQQTLTARSAVLQHSSEFYLGIRSSERLQHQNQPIALHVVAVGTGGKPWPQAVTALATLSRVVWHSVRIKGAGNTVTYKNERQLEKLAEQSIATTAHDAEPVASQLVPRSAGEYVLHVRAEDKNGRPVRSAVEFAVSGPEPLSWNYHNDAVIALVPDKKVYRAGDRARLLVKAPFGGRAWVTIEREKVLRSFQVELQGNAPAIEVPLSDDDAPNVFVSVCLLRGAEQSKRKIPAAEYRLGYCKLTVEKPQTRLQVQVVLPQSDYRPGQEVKVETRVADFEGKPVPSAEVVLYAVDEGVLDLMGYDRPDPRAFFHAPRSLAVRTHTSFPYMLAEDPARSAFGNKGHLIGGGGDEAGRLRENFAACAFWHARLSTDAAGRVSATFKAPDGLTRYRVFAVAHTAAHQFGAGESAFRINKPLLIEAAWPRFAREGDRIEARAIIHNMTDRARQVRVQMTHDDKLRVVGAAAQQVITVPAKGTQAVVWPVEFLATGTTETLWKAICTEDATLTDALKTSLPIHHATPLLREIILSRTTAKEADLLKGIDPQLAEGSGTITVTLSNTRLSELAEASDYLLRYPYGCVEQTTSAMLPWLVLQRHHDVFPTQRFTLAAADSAITKGIARLVGMQTPGGGLAYWPDGNRAELWGSAYGGMGLALAKQSGHHVPGEVLDKLSKYLAAQLRKPANTRGDDGNYGLNERCLALYTLALLDGAEAAFHEQLFMQRRNLSAADRALLAMAILKSDGSRDMARQLLEEDAPALNRGWFVCAGQSAALQLLAWTHCQPESPRVDAAVTELLLARHGGHWQSTQGNAWALLALAEYAQRVEGQLQPVSGTLITPDKKAPFSLDEKQRAFVFTSEQRAGAAAANLKVLNPDGRRLYITTKLEMRSKVRLMPRQDNGFAVTRSYTKVNEDGTLAPGADWKVGDLVCVTLNVGSAQPAHFVVVDDALPAALETVHPEFKTQQVGADRLRTSDWRADHRELRTDRALFFFDHFAPGDRTIRYLARVRCAGQTLAPATKVEAMYQPQRHGLAGSVELKSQPLN